MVDQAYALYAVGLLADAAPEAALRFAHNNIHTNIIEKKATGHGRTPTA